MKTKILLILFGLIAGLVLLEASLNIISNKYAKPGIINPENKIPQNNEYRILCAGDSFTYGVGAGFDHSYPAYLEKFLSQKISNKKITVFNFGIPGTNTTCILRKFKNDILQTQPQCVILMAGLNDLKHFSGVELSAAWPKSLRKSILNLKTIKLINIIQHNFRQKMLSFKINHLKSKSLNKNFSSEQAQKLLLKANLLRKKGKFKQANKIYKKAFAASPIKTKVLLEWGRNYVFLDKLKEALFIFAHVIELDNNNKAVYEEIENIFTKKKMQGKAVEFYSWLLTKHQDNMIIKQNLSHHMVLQADRAFISKDYDEVMRSYGEAFSVYPENEDIFKRIAYKETSWYPENLIEEKLAKHNTMQKLIENNLKEIVKICKQNNIKLIFVGYPRVTPIAVKKIGKQHNIMLISLVPIFDRFIGSSLESEYFTSDGHCSKEGYKLVAETIAEKLFWQLSKTKAP